MLVSIILSAFFCWLRIGIIRPSTQSSLDALLSLDGLFVLARNAAVVVVSVLACNSILKRRVDAIIPMLLSVLALILFKLIMKYRKKHIDKAQ